MYIMKIYRIDNGWPGLEFDRIVVIKKVSSQRFEENFVDEGENYATRCT